MSTRDPGNSSSAPSAGASSRAPARSALGRTRMVGWGLAACAGLCAGAIAVAACHRAGEASAQGEGVSPDSTTSGRAPTTASATASGGAPVSRNVNIPANENIMKTTTITTGLGELPIDASTGKVALSEEQWKQRLSPEQYRILRMKGTERAFTGKEWNTNGQGEYRCAGCDNLLFTGDDKFLSDCGWPAFDKCVKGSIAYHDDRSYGMARTEVTCARCGGHLGHIFDDGPTSTGMRYCINSVSIRNVQGGAKEAGEGAKPEDAAPKGK